MGKLVRDKIPELIRADGRRPVVRVLDDDAYRDALHDKLLEEAAELRAASTVADVLAEAADVLEVLTAIVGVHGATVDDVLALAADKRRERGGFVEKLWLESVNSSDAG